MKSWDETKGDQAARLRQRKHDLLRGLQIPRDALPGYLGLTHRRCGKPSCWCADTAGHPMWSLTFMADSNKRKKRVLHVPEELLKEVRPLVEQGREFKDAIAEVFAANAQLLALWRRQSTKKRRKKKT
ncbi:MAG TPA: DUF6788 family protein [Terriglobales bacterium]|nr:DUF6788 family protein [Terriglobales bacterium]